MKYDLSEINNIIENRRTIYPELFSSRKVHKEQIDRLLMNATWAPSHGMTQPWRFKVFMNDGLKKLSKYQSELYQTIIAEDDFNEMKFEKLINRPILSSAVVAICMQRQKSKKIPEIDFNKTVTINSRIVFGNTDNYTFDYSFIYYKISNTKF